MEKGNITISDLKNIIGLKDLPDDHLQWILINSEYTEFEDGFQINKKGDPIDFLWIILEGKINYNIEIISTLCQAH